ncbi:hypothetical protein C2E23DRAFT_841941 [Lenzites betulinus]|nr:hypothetical protein C2E23DRAFT_841941 [Lenzites betulinus]
MEKRCNQCKVKASNLETARTHGKLTGHQWRPMIACVECSGAFNKQKQYKAHLPSCPARIKVTAGGTMSGPPGTTSEDSTFLEKLSLSEEDHRLPTTHTHVAGPDLLAPVAGDGTPIPRYHCRSCLKDPSIDPVATICGHIFCRSCVVNELAKGTGCPTCNKLFFIKLDL